MVTFRRGWTAVTLAALVCLSAFAQATAPPALKIDADLLQALASPSATAPFLVVLKDKANLTIAASGLTWGDKKRVVVRTLKATAEQTQIPVRALLSSLGASYTPFWIHNAIYVPRGNLALANALALRPEVGRISREPVAKLVSDGRIANALTSTDWNILKIRADQAWPLATGAGIVVAAIDTGVRYTHSTLVNQYRGKNGTAFVHPGNWSDPTGVCGGAPCDNVGHGTMVAGLMVGSDGASNQTGVAPGAKWIACKGCSSGSACYGSHLLACGQWIMDPLGDGSGNDQPDIVNNSWSAPGADTWFQDMVRSWRAAGILPVFAAGNSGPACGTVETPGNYPESISVGTTDANDLIKYFSARGPSPLGGVKPNLTAPGVNVRSASSADDYQFAYGSGTSFSAPHVSGTAALMWSVSPSLRSEVASTEHLLYQSAVALTTLETCGGTAGQVPNNVYGRGRVDALAAVLAAPGGGVAAADDAYAVAEDGSLTIAAPGVLANDTGSGLTAVLVTPPAHGSLTLNSGGSFVYTPQANYNGIDQFNYKARSGTTDSNTALVRITVNAVNDSPLAVDDAASTTKGVAININVLANDSDPDGNPLSVTGAVASAGTAGVNPDKTIRYTPPAAAGAYTVTYTISDGAASDTGLVTVTVTNRAPVAVDDTASAVAGTAININVLANDSDPDGDTLSVTQAVPSAGTATINADKTLRYTPPATAGTYTINYTISDGAAPDTGLVTVTVTLGNRPPVAVDDVASATVGLVATINVLANDSDPDRNPLRVTAAVASAGTATVNTNNTIRYTPPSAAGTYTITYTISDGSLIDTGLVVVTVTVNQPPVAVNDSAVSPVNPGKVRIQVLANDYDPNGSLLASTLTVVRKPVKAVAKVVRVTATDYRIDYVPKAGMTGPDSFTYTVRDNQGAVSNQATVSTVIQ